MRLHRAQHPMTCRAQIVLLCCIYQRHGDRMLRCTVVITQRIQRLNLITFYNLQSPLLLLPTNGKCMWHPVNLAVLLCVSICSTSEVLVDHFTLECISIRKCSNHGPVQIQWLDVFALKPVDKFHREDGGGSWRVCANVSNALTMYLLYSSQNAMNPHKHDEGQGLLSMIIIIIIVWHSALVHTFCISVVTPVHFLANFIQWKNNAIIQIPLDNNRNSFASQPFHEVLRSFFSLLSTAYHFQQNLLRTMIQIENTYFELGKSSAKNCLIICDRGVMDASACKCHISESRWHQMKWHFLFAYILFSDISKEKWDEMMATNHWNTVELRDNRYNQIVHMVSAANGAEDFYSTEVCADVCAHSFISAVIWFFFRR